MLAFAVLEMPYVAVLADTHFLGNDFSAGATDAIKGGGHVIPRLCKPWSRHATERTTPAGSALRLLRRHPGRRETRLTAVNQVLAASGVNITGQYLQTLPDVGYVVMDVETDDVSPLIDGLGALDATVRTRWLR